MLDSGQSYTPGRNAPSEPQDPKAERLGDRGAMTRFSITSRKSDRTTGNHRQSIRRAAFDQPAVSDYIVGMAVRPIVRMGDPVLSAVASPVADPRAADVRELVEDMIETMRAAPGIGLAAPQVGVGLRVIVFEVPEARATRAAGDEPRPAEALINPVIEPMSDSHTLAFEGCLSIPGMKGEVPRWHRIRYRGVDVEGNSVDRIASGWHARVVQHEVDHLDGVLYPSRIIDWGRFGYIDEIDRMLDAEDAAEDAAEAAADAALDAAGSRS